MANFKYRGELFKDAPPCIHETAKWLRRRQTESEQILWSYLRKKPGGFKFRRQHPFARYVADFYCHAGRLVIELDGSVHLTNEAKINDEHKSADIKRMGLTLLRFKNEDVLNAPEQVVEKILSFLKTVVHSS